MTLDELRRKYKKDILRIADKYGVTDVRVFGSVARGDAREDSDVDLLIRLGPPLGFEFAGMYNELKEALGREVDLVTDTHVHPLMKEQIFREAVPL